MVPGEEDADIAKVDELARAQAVASTRPDASPAPNDSRKRNDVGLAAGIPPAGAPPDLPQGPEQTTEPLNPSYPPKPSNPLNPTTQVDDSRDDAPPRESTPPASGASNGIAAEASPSTTGEPTPTESRLLEPQVSVKYEAWGALFGEYLLLATAQCLRLALSHALPQNLSIALRLQSPQGDAFRLSARVGACDFREDTEHYDVLLMVEATPDWDAFASHALRSLEERLGRHASARMLRAAGLETQNFPSNARPGKKSGERRR